MVKLNRDRVVIEALDLLDEVGLDAVSTRRLAQRLGIEQPSLYWHFRSKAELLSAMAEAAMRPHAMATLPDPAQDWREWFIENHRRFRQTLLGRRDGARLHAGTVPVGSGLDRARAKVAFLVAAGVPERDAQMAMLAASHLTVGSVLEQQNDLGQSLTAADDVPVLDHESAFNEALQLIVEGLSHRLSDSTAAAAPASSPGKRS